MFFFGRQSCARQLCKAGFYRAKTGYGINIERKWVTAKTGYLGGVWVRVWDLADSKNHVGMVAVLSLASLDTERYALLYTLPVCAL
jgi:hypothetical protein